MTATAAVLEAEQALAEHTQHLRKPVKHHLLVMDRLVGMAAQAGRALALVVAGVEPVQ